MLSTAMRIATYGMQFIYFYYYMLVMAQNIRHTKYDIKYKLLILGNSILLLVGGILLEREFPFNTITLLLIVFLFFTIVLKIKISKSIMVAITLPIFLVISEILAVGIFTISFNTTAATMLATPWMSFSVNAFTSIITYIAIYIFNKILINKQKVKDCMDRYNQRYTKLTIYLILFTIVPQAILLPLNKYNHESLLLIFNFVSLVAISIFLFWYISDILEKEKMQEQLTTLEMDNKTLGGMVDGVRTIKHDFNNIFQAINGYICSKQYDKLEEYVLKVMKECNIVNTLSIINKNTFDDPANYGVIGSKYFIATENNICMDLDVTVSFKDINFPMAELSRIFGILLDNAIEATSKCENKYIRLEIKYIPKKNATVIRILNTYNTSNNIELNSLFNKGYSTKKVKSGLGLWEVKKIISKYKHAQIYATIENEKFVQNLIIENT